MGRVFLILGVSLMLLITGVSSAQSYHYSAKIVSGIYSNVVSVLIKRIWSLKSTSKPAVSSRPIMKFESGYNVETLFDGTKLGVEPYAVQMLPSRDLLILDSTHSNIYKISSSLSLYSQPKLIAGSAEGISGHVDGKLRDTKLNHPTGITSDDRGNIYIADTDNMAIRKISEAGVTTIAGGKWGRSGGHIDGPSEDAKFSSDFDLVYVGSSCSLLIIDRGSKAIREIQLQVDDCVDQDESDFPLGVAILVASSFFGYMLARLQERVSSIVSSHSEPKQAKFPPSPYQMPVKSVRPPLIPTEDNVEKPEQSISYFLLKLLGSALGSVRGILANLIPGHKKKPSSYEHTSQQMYSQQESFAIPPEDEPPSIDLRTPRKTYPFISKDSRKLQEIRHGGAFYHGQESDHQRYHMRHVSAPQTFTEQSWDKTEEFVFGAGDQEQVAKRKKAMMIKPVDYGRRFYDHAGFQYHSNSNGYDYAYRSYA